VSEATLSLFNALHAWRAEPAKRDGVPIYLACTNRQLAVMVNARSGSLSMLAPINGIDKANLDSHGEQVLALLARHRREPHRQSAPGHRRGFDGGPLQPGQALPPSLRQSAPKMEEPFLEASQSARLVSAGLSTREDTK